MIQTHRILKYEDLERLIKRFKIPGSTELIIQSGIHKRFVESISTALHPNRIILHPLRSHNFTACTLDLLVSCHPKNQDLFFLESNNGVLRVPMVSVSFEPTAPAVFFQLIDCPVMGIPRADEVSQ